MLAAESGRAPVGHISFLLYSDAGSHNMQTHCTHLLSSHLQGQANSVGWALVRSGYNEQDDILALMRTIGAELGRVVVGRHSASTEFLRPRTRVEASPRSQSAAFGLNEIPLHSDQSHKPVPCRYLVLGCLDADGATSTNMLKWRKLNLSEDEWRLLEQAPILVDNGRLSFFSTILPANRSYMRYDRACLRARCNRGKTALTLLEHRLSEECPTSHFWRRGDILLIDNWNTLHGRAASTQSNRCLARMMFDGR